MATSANIKNVKRMSGPGYFREVGKERAKNFGHTESISWNSETTNKEYFSSVSGTSEKYDSDVDTISASGEITLRETSLKNLVMQFAGDVEALVQSAVVSAVFSGTGAEKGDLVRLSHLSVSDVEITGATAGVDFEVDDLDAKALDDKGVGRHPRDDSVRVRNRVHGQLGPGRADAEIPCKPVDYSV